MWCFHRILTEGRKDVVIFSNSLFPPAVTWCDGTWREFGLDRRSDTKTKQWIAFGDDLNSGSIKRGRNSKFSWVSWKKIVCFCQHANSAEIYIFSSKSSYSVNKRKAEGVKQSREVESFFKSISLPFLDLQKNRWCFSWRKMAERWTSVPVELGRTDDGRPTQTHRPHSWQLRCTGNIWHQLTEEAVFNVFRDPDRCRNTEAVDQREASTAPWPRTE